MTAPNEGGTPRARFKLRRDGAKVKEATTMGLTRPQRLQQARTASHNKAAALMLVSYAPLARAETQR